MISPLSDICTASIFPHSATCYFSLYGILVSKKKKKIFNVIQLAIFSVMISTFCILFKKSFPTLRA